MIDEVDDRSNTPPLMPDAAEPDDEVDTDTASAETSITDEAVDVDAMTELARPNPSGNANAACTASA